MAASTKTCDLLCASLSIEVHLPPPPMPAETALDPTYHARIEAEPRLTLAGYPATQPSRTRLLDRIMIRFQGATIAQRDAFALLAAQAGSRVILYSPPGSDAYGADEYILLTTTQGWRSERFGRWSGVVILGRRGDTI